MVPLISPVSGSMTSPGGRPVAANDGVPLAPTDHGVIACPASLDWSAGVVIVSGLDTAQLKLTLALGVAWPTTTVTKYGPPAADPTGSVPVMWPLEGFMLRPGGRPSAK